MPTAFCSSARRLSPLRLCGVYGHNYPGTRHVNLPVKSCGNSPCCLFRERTSATFGGSIGRTVLSRIVKHMLHSMNHRRASSVQKDGWNCGSRHSFGTRIAPELTSLSHSAAVLTLAYRELRKRAGLERLRYDPVRHTQLDFDRRPARPRRRGLPKVIEKMRGLQQPLEVLGADRQKQHVPK
jgi:hypothetical protein